MEISSLLVNGGIPLPQHGKVYKACIRYAMLYGGGGGDVDTYWEIDKNIACL